MPNIEIVRIQDIGLSGADDISVLAWAAKENRILLTHDVSTITKYANERISSGQKMPGVFEVSYSLSIQSVIEDILLLVEYCLDNEWEGKILYLPLK